ncbi:hypothetical protein LUZ63_016041 [Rhynchospora breviuscula]|uniref:Reverse transcriptase zinc-binding domain-containing protein n=1 Tax=Rhynchospora breviuscula TaxID=2022672 RepID=A0A9Q0HMM9_9POAL|nr:hypothetical protein LUZ63_016041 [Rhynchospora breviuscula]
MGGLGVKDLEKFGEAFFLKMVWSLMAEEDKPWVKICKAKYFPNVGYWRARNAAGGSKMWKQILGKRSFFSENVIWNVGNDEKTYAISQPWFQGWSVREEAIRNDRNLKIKDLIDASTNGWDVHKLNLLFEPSQVQQIIQGDIRPVLGGQIEDKLIWNLVQNSKYTAKQGYEVIMQAQEAGGIQQNVLWEEIWKRKNIAPRVKIFIWRLINRGLPTGVHMHSRFPNYPPTCQRCNEENEYDMHCLFFCNTSRQVWFASALGIRVHELPMEINLTMQQLIPKLDDEGVQMFLNTMWEIWKKRNKAVIELNTFKPVEVLKKVNIMQNPCITNQVPDLELSNSTMDKAEVHSEGWQVLIDASSDVIGNAWCAYILYEQGFIHSMDMRKL